MGVQRMTKEHLGLAVNLALPSFVVITKIDISPDHVKQQTLQVISRILKSGAAGRKMPMVVKTVDDVVTAAREVGNKKMVPIFFLSNVTGEGVDMLKQFLNLLPSAPKWEKKLSKPAEFQVDESFHITGIGTVVSGTVTGGRISVNDEMLFGPDSLGAFQKVTFKGIHNKRVPVTTAQAGQSCSFAVKKIKRNQVRKGQLLIHPSVKPKSSWTFTAEILILYHSTSVQLNYQPVVHIGTVRQAARLTSMTGKRVLRTGERATCHFTFMYRPEYIKPGARLLFREGRTKGVGKLLTANEDGLGPQPQIQTEAELQAKHKEVLGRMTGVGMLRSKTNSADDDDKSQVSPLALPAAEETVADAKARVARQAQLESDWAASVSQKGLGHGNARKKLNAAIIEDQESYPKISPQTKAKPTTPTTPQKPRRTAWGDSSPGSKKGDEQARVLSSPTATPPKEPTKAMTTNSRADDEAEKRRMKNVKKKSAQNRKKAIAS
jgi:translation elongation factor EF-Tu-like GTPase